MSRSNRKPNELRPVKITTNWINHGEGNALIEFGNTRVLCVASFTPSVPRWMEGKGKGWVTAEYSMLPRATHTRSDRESVKGKLSGRTQEISRLIGRSLRASIDMNALGENTIIIDCDVLQADGGTRTAAITGGFVALALAINWGKTNGHIESSKKVILQNVAAISVGLVDGEPLLDLEYEEDVNADTDMNIVATSDGKFVEIQGTAEGEPFSRELLNQLLDLGLSGCKQLMEHQESALKN